MPEPFEAGVGAIGSLASNRGLYVVVVMIGGEKKSVHAESSRGGMAAGKGVMMVDAM